PLGGDDRPVNFKHADTTTPANSQFFRHVWLRPREDARGELHQHTAIWGEKFVIAGDAPARNPGDISLFSGARTLAERDAFAREPEIERIAEWNATNCHGAFGTGHYAR